MFLKAIISLAVTDNDYRVVLKKKMNLLYIMLILGVITFAFSIIFSTGKYAYLSSFLSGFYTGIGSALIGVSIVLIIKTRKILKDENKIKQKRLEAQDERNQMIVRRSIYSSAIILMILAYIGLMVSGIFNLTIFWTLWVVIIVYAVFFISLSVYYNQKF